LSTKSCGGGIIFDIVDEYGEKTLTEAVTIADKSSQVDVSQVDDGNTIISNQPVIASPKHIELVLDIPKGVRPVINNPTCDKYVIDTPKHIQHCQVSCPEGSKNCKNCQPTMENIDMYKKDIENDNKLAKPCEMHHEDNAINIMIQMDGKMQCQPSHTKIQ